MFIEWMISLFKQSYNPKNLEIGNGTHFLTQSCSYPTDTFVVQGSSNFNGLLIA